MTRLELAQRINRLGVSVRDFQVHLGDDYRLQVVVHCLDSAGRFDEEATRETMLRIRADLGRSWTRERLEHGAYLICAPARKSEEAA